MNAFLLVIPFILIRFLLLSVLDKKSLKRVAFFAPLIGKEKVAYWVYQISNILFFIYLCVLKIKVAPYLFYVGWLIYGLGVVLCIMSVSSFSSPAENGINNFLSAILRISIWEEHR